MGIITTFQINQTVNEQSTFNTTNESEIKECSCNDISISTIQSNSNDVIIQNWLNKSNINVIDRGLSNAHFIQMDNNSDLTGSDQESHNDYIQVIMKVIVYATMKRRMKYVWVIMYIM